VGLLNAFKSNIIIENPLMEPNKNPFSLSLQAQYEQENEGRDSARAAVEDPDLNKMIE
jgi:hypothetical protein